MADQDKTAARNCPIRIHHEVHAEIRDIGGWTRRGSGTGYFMSRVGKCVRPETKGKPRSWFRKGSQFYHSILGTSPDTTLTFWVYPDSYAIFAKLKKFGHENGYSVAGRPLPFGIPIAGSPDGTRSASE